MWRLRVTPHESTKLSMILTLTVNFWNQNNFVYLWQIIILPTWKKLWQAQWSIYLIVIQTFCTNDMSGNKRFVTTLGLYNISESLAMDLSISAHMTRTICSAEFKWSSLSHCVVYPSFNWRHLIIPFVSSNFCSLLYAYFNAKIIWGPDGSMS